MRNEADWGRRGSTFQRLRGMTMVNIPLVEPSIKRWSERMRNLENVCLSRYKYRINMSMTVLAYRGPRICFGSLFLLLAGCIWAQTHSNALPRFEDYPATETFTGIPVTPKLATALDQRYSNQIRDGVENGYGVFRDSGAAARPA